MKRIVLSLVLITSIILLTSCKSSNVKDVESLIADIGPVTEASEEAILAAEQAYAALSEAEQKKVENADELVSARSLYNSIAAYLEAYNLFLQVVDEYNNEVSLYNEIAKQYNARNIEFITYLDEIKNSGIFNGSAYDQNTIIDLKNLTADISSSVLTNLEFKSEKTVSPKLDFSSSSQLDIDSATSDLKSVISQTQSDLEALTAEYKSITLPDYSEQTNAIEAQKMLAETSIAILNQITNPSEDFIISRLFELEHVSDVAAATEEHDPNGRLHKQGGYTAAIYFRYDLVSEDYLGEGDLIDQGTDAGGQIEVYATVEDAVERNEYLSAFDGSFLNVGSHTVLGTCVIRCSDYLTATQQQELEAAIIELLTRLD